MMFLSQVVALLVFATSVSVSASALDEQHLRRSRLRADRHATLATRQSTSFTYVGCVTDNTARLLTGSYTKDNSLTPAKCFTYCANYQYAAMENGNECYCGNTLATSSKAGVAAAESQCSTACGGGGTAKCGGSWRLSLYKRGAVTSSSSSRSSTSSSKTSTTSTASKTSSSSSTSKTTTTTSSSKSTTTTSTSSSKSSSSSSSSSSSASKGNFPSASVVGVAAPPAGATKALYAHHIVGNTYSYTQSTWADDINQAYAAGFDGFALNVGGDADEPTRVGLAYAAAQAQGKFKLFISLDVSSLGCSTAANAQSMADLIGTYASSSAQAKYNGKVIVSTFAGENCQFGQGSLNAGWTYFRSLLTNKGLSVYIVPAIFSDPTQFSGMSWMDGEFNWNSGWPTAGSPLDTSSDTYYQSQLGSKGYMPAVSPCFFTYYSPQTYNKDWIYRSDDWLLARRMEQLIAMRNSVVMAELISWNDYGESHYVGPIRADQPNSQGWTNGMPHTAWLSVIAYYAPAFKTGSYPSNNDLLVLWSRPHPKAANPTNPTCARPTRWDDTDDNLYAFVVLSAASTVTIYSGSNSASWSLPAGPSKLSIGSAAGGIGGKIVSARGGVVKSYDSGSAFTYNLTPTDYNYNYFVASA